MPPKQHGQQEQYPGNSKDQRPLDQQQSPGTTTSGNKTTDEGGQQPTFAG